MAALDRVQPAPHDHVFLGAAHDENARRTQIVVLLTAVMMVGEITAGLVFNSMALLADGFHMATHAGALAIAAGAYAFARRHASRNFRPDHRGTGGPDPRLLVLRRVVTSMRPVLSPIVDLPRRPTLVQGQTSNTVDSSSGPIGSVQEKYEIC